MEIFTFFKGMGIGLAVAVTVGPIGILCIQRSLTQGFRVGFMTGLGAATADAAYGSSSFWPRRGNDHTCL